MEATLEAEESWVAEMNDKAKLSVRYYSECTPGYYNNEGKLGNPNGFFSAGYGAGSVRFFEIVKAWRAEGTLQGIEFT